MKKAELAKLRTQIDSIDDEILALLDRRMEAVKKVGELKASTGAAIFVPERERAVLERLEAQALGALPKEAIRPLWREIFAAARALERPLNVAFLGPEGTYSHEAAVKRFSSQTAFTPLNSIEEVFTAVEFGRADYGCVPVENSTEGVVTSTLDRLFRSTLKIISEFYMPIEHVLAGVDGDLSRIKKVYSHPQALAQCRGYFASTLPGAELIECASTAAAARAAAQEGGAAAAVCGEEAARIAGLAEIARGVGDDVANLTRFVLIGKQESAPSGDDKTSLCLGMTDRTGALYDALAPFKKAKISLTMIESRPSRVERFNYSFYVDLSGHKLDKEVAEAIREVTGICAFVKVLGSYPRGKII